MYFNALKNGKLSVFEITVGDEKRTDRVESDSPFHARRGRGYDRYGHVAAQYAYIGDAKLGTGSGVVYEYDLYGRILNTYAVNGTPGALFADR